jgi:hypothetical protein
MRLAVLFAMCSCAEDPSPAPGNPPPARDPLPGPPADHAIDLSKGPKPRLEFSKAFSILSDDATTYDCDIRLLVEPGGILDVLWMRGRDTDRGHFEFCDLYFARIDMSTGNAGTPRRLSKERGLVCCPFLFTTPEGRPVATYGHQGTFECIDIGDSQPESWESVHLTTNEERLDYPIALTCGSALAVGGSRSGSDPGHYWYAQVGTIDRADPKRFNISHSTTLETEGDGGQVRAISYVSSSDTLCVAVHCFDFSSEEFGSWGLLYSIGPGDLKVRGRHRLGDVHAVLNEGNFETFEDRKSSWVGCSSGPMLGTGRNGGWVCWLTGKPGGKAALAGLRIDENGLPVGDEVLLSSGADSNAELPVALHDDSTGLTWFCWHDGIKKSAGFERLVIADSKGTLCDLGRIPMALPGTGKWPGFHAYGALADGAIYVPRIVRAGDRSCIEIYKARLVFP